jgi:ribosomal protein S18 acetylase RimI-like enzyme
VSVDDVVFAIVDPRSDDAQRALRSYIEEVTGNIEEPSMRIEHAADVDDFDPPRGAFVLATRGGTVVACGALRPFAGPDDIAEIKRMWVRPDARGEGLGTAMLAELERLSRANGHTRVRLDTNENLLPAIRMYERAGYHRVERFNDTPDATHFYEKRL